MNTAETADSADFKAPLHILLAEDNPINEKVAVRLLERRGHTVEVARTGLEAVSASARTKFDVILMDVQMPEMGGLEATALIRQRERGTGNHVPIVAMTAHAMEGDRERCLAAGMDDYISKPVRQRDMERIIAQWLNCDRVRAERPSSHNSSTDESAESSPIARLREIAGSDDESFIREVLQDFLEQVSGGIQAMTRAATAGDAAALLEVAHRLKGTSASLGIHRLASICAELESLAASGSVTDAERLIGLIDQEFKRARKGLEDELQSV